MNRLFWHRVLSGHELRVTLLMSALLISTAFAFENADSIRMARFEQQFFARSYPQDNLEQRLNRLEDVVYGKNQPGSITNRMSRLLQALEKQYAPIKLPTAKHVNPVSDSTDYYPTVTAIEQAVFKQTFIHQPITERLSRLETQTFHMTYSRNANSERVDRLAEHYPNEVRMARIAQIARERQNVTKPRTDIKTIPPVVQKLPPIQLDSHSLAQGGKPDKHRIFFARKADNMSNNSKTEQSQFDVGASQGQSTQYSQEMMQMLPPQVREQMGQHKTPETQQRIPVTTSPPLQQQEQRNKVNTTTVSPPTPGFLGVPLQ